MVCISIAREDLELTENPSKGYLVSKSIRVDCRKGKNPSTRTKSESMAALYCSYGVVYLLVSDKL